MKNNKKISATGYMPRLQSLIHRCESYVNTLGAKTPVANSRGAKAPVANSLGAKTRVANMLMAKGSCC